MLIRNLLAVISYRDYFSCHFLQGFILLKIRQKVISTFMESVEVLDAPLTKTDPAMFVIGKNLFFFFFFLLY